MFFALDKSLLFWMVLSNVIVLYHKIPNKDPPGYRPIRI